VRPPLVKITDAEIALIKDALMEAELLGTESTKGRHAA
jgi:4-hydroxy-tetrahydrodipicolinate synthase